VIHHRDSYCGAMVEEVGEVDKFMMPAVTMPRFESGNCFRMSGVSRQSPKNDPGRVWCDYIVENHGKDGQRGS
jgi:hypothetical protein